MLIAIRAFIVNVYRYSFAVQLLISLLFALFVVLIVVVVIVSVISAYNGID